MNGPLRRAAMVLSFALYLAYMVWRIAFTLNFYDASTTALTLMLHAAEWFGLVSLGLFYFQVWDVREPEVPEPPEGATVDVFIATYNEDAQILRGTILSAIDMEYPHKTYVLDDGARPEIRALAAELGCGYLDRDGNLHAKAGNLNHALEITSGDFVVILDADHVPERHFLLRMLGYFRDEKMGYVQSPHGFYNFDNFEGAYDHDRKKYWDEGYTFHQLIQIGKNRWNSACFAGSAAMFRRAALESVGYVAVETITEDLHTGMRIHGQGWKSLAISERLVSGQAAPDVTTFQTQRLRWGEGNLSVVHHDSPFTTKGLSLAQRLSYVSTILHWTSGIFRGLSYLVPMLVLLTGITPVAQVTPGFLALAASNLIMIYVAVVLACRGRASLWEMELFGMMSFWTQARATWKAFLSKKVSKFVVTAKRGRQSNSVLKLVLPQIVLCALGVFAIIWAALRVAHGFADWRTAIFALPFVLYTLVLAGAVLLRSLRPTDQRFDYRHRLVLPVRYRDPDATEPAWGVTADVSEGGISVVGRHPLRPEQEVELELFWADQRLACRGRVVGARPTPKGLVLPTFRAGIQFLDLRPEQRNALARACYHFGVARTYQYFEQAGRREGWWRRLKGSWIGREPRRRYRFPLRRRRPGAEREPAVVSVTEDVNSRAISFLEPDDGPIADEVELELYTPLGAVMVRGRAIRHHEESVSAHRLRRVVYELHRFQGEGRSIWQSLVVKPQPQRLREDFSAHVPRRRDPVLKPVAVGLATAAMIALSGVTLFRVDHHDELFLRRLQSQAELAPGDRAELQEVLARAEASPRRKVAILAGLREYFGRVGDHDTYDRLSRRLADLHDPGEADYRLALADALHRRGHHEDAVGEFAAVLALRRPDDGRIPPRAEVVLYAARNAVRADDAEEARVRFSEALASAPGDAALAHEAAGWYAAQGDARAAIDAYAGHELGPDARYRRATQRVELQRWPEAEADARAVVAARPEDPRGRRLLAQVLSARGRHDQALVLYDGLVEGAPEDAALRRQRALCAVWSGDYERATPLLLDEWRAAPDDPSLWRPLSEAIAGSRRVPEPALEALRRIDAEARAGDDALLERRLADAWMQLDEPGTALPHLQRLHARDPGDEELGSLLVDCLLALERYEDGLAVLDSAHAEDPRRAAFLLAGAEEHERAAVVCRTILARDPADGEIETLLSDCLVAGGEYEEAREICAGLLQRDPSSRGLRERLARLCLWTDRHDESARWHAQLLEEEPERRELWPGFLDAMAGAQGQEVGRGPLRRISGSLREQPQVEEVLLERLCDALLRLGEDREAADHLERLSASRPEDRALLARVADLWHSLGEYGRAEAHYARLLDEGSP